MVAHARGATRGAFQVSALDPTCDRDNRPVTTLLLTRFSLAFPGALTAPPDSREILKFTNPVFREETITAPLPCCECMQTDVPYTHLFCARREGLQDRMTHVNYSSCIVLISPGTVTPSVVVDSEYTYDRAVQHSRGATRTRPGGAARIPGGATRVSLGGATRTRHPSSGSGSARRAPTLVIVGQTSARFTSPSPTWRLMEDLRGGVVSTRPGNASCTCRLLHCSCRGATRQHFTCLSR